MKRILAIVLVLVMLIPMGTAAHAEQIEKKPFYCISMSNFESDVPYVYWMPFFWTKTPNADTQWPEVSCYGSNFEGEIAEKLKEDFNNRPAGSRYFQLTLVQTGFRNKMEKIVYFESAIEFTKQWVVEFLKSYKEIGGELDGIIVDLEYIESHAYYLYDHYAGTRNKEENKNIYNEIVDDPRFDEQIRPLLEEYGFEFYENPEGEKSEIWCINSRADVDGHDNCYGIWNHVMEIMKREAINEAVLYPLLEYYPDATVSDYQSDTQVTWQKAIDNHGGKVMFNIKGAGNLSNTNTYTGRPEQSYFGWGTPVYNNPPSFNNAVFEATPFSVAMYDINLFKNMYASTEDGMIDAWISHYRYNLEAEGYGSTYNGTPYYSEILFHLGLLNPQPFLGYFITNEIQAAGSTMEDTAKTASDVMAELTRVAGYADRRPIGPVVNWNGGYILSGMYAGGRNIWRLTPDTDMVSLENFKIEGTDPTFSVGGLTITFPGGKILEDGEIYEAGTCGYWIETSKDVEPVITSTADRYSNYPSFGENFDSYKADSAFTNSEALPKACWSVEGTAAIRANGEGNALELLGTTTVKNVKLPQNITAGDEYAKQQAWEVTLTLPEGLNKSAVIKLLGCGENDLGIKITDSKVYYGEAGEYQQMDGVSLNAGTYRIRREVDFRTEGSFTSSYTVYDASGKLVGQAKDAAMQSLDLPVTSIEMAVTNAKSAVLLDEYKLYPTGVTTVFELYETEKGLRLTDLSTARTENTAYRLSWMNASADPATAYIYDSVSGDVIKTVEMAPGMDGVITGVVEVTEGKSVQLALRTDTASNDTGNEQEPIGTTPSDQEKPGDTGENTGENTEENTNKDFTLIIVLAAAVLVIAAVVIIIVVSSKKKAEKAQKTPEAEAIPAAEETDESEEVSNAEE